MWMCMWRTGATTDISSWLVEGVRSWLTSWASNFVLTLKQKPGCQWRSLWRPWVLRGCTASFLVKLRTGRMELLRTAVTSNILPWCSTVLVRIHRFCMFIHLHIPFIIHMPLNVLFVNLWAEQMDGLFPKTHCHPLPNPHVHKSLSFLLFSSSGECLFGLFILIVRRKTKKEYF